MSGELTPGEFKSCCASFYADDVVRRILGDSFHPGGEALTLELLDAVKAGPDDDLLDVATGPGASAVLAARKKGCRVTGVDLSTENLARTGALAKERGVADLVTVREADAERLPFEDGSFDVVLCECAFCTFVDKTTAAREMARVLRPGGRLALSDMTLETDAFPEDLDTLLMRVACISDAVPGERLEAFFSDEGFVDLETGDARWALHEMVEDIRGRLLAVELASKLGKIDLGGIDVQEGKRMARRSIEIIEDGTVGYVTLTGRLPAR
ncbi:MAG: class I SAM-dependent methyltransferase [Deltaproteobacteria bacterium]|nr:class I SAM-dependent methyltransferase [Deltaproteobacteria bacterium]